LQSFGACGQLCEKFRSSARLVYPLLFHIGRIAIPTYGACTALALLAALTVSVREAHQRGLPAHKVWNLGLIAILVTLLGGRLLLVATHLAVFREHPFWVLGLASPPGGWIGVGGAALGVAAAVLYALAEGLPLLRTADAAAPAVALAFAINRIGAFCGGLDWGRRTHLPWGVTYRSIVAYLWYRVPLGVRLHPVQLYDAAFSLLILAVLLWMLRSRRTGHPGEVVGTWLFLYGLCRFFVEFFRGDLAGREMFRDVFTLAQVLSLAAVILGGVLWLQRKPRNEPAA
jgi:phosphatidylglycerol:prolipoprotein diacylglycerol transferase